MIERTQDFAPARLTPIFLQGMLTEVLTPKLALFFLASLPPHALAFRHVSLGLFFEASRAVFVAPGPARYPPRGVNRPRIID
jgi:threonine/homoserine/homoserine lactone efflux protein